jgi:D-beta-D-heptose 7-phosphate kinase/D-beta-D-heptose 1-phosphate adenosyltransferase
MIKNVIKSVLIIGDVMLDVYRTGTVSRVSPEAPIPVFDQESIGYSLGGAANVALNIRSLLGLSNVDFLFPEILEEDDRICDFVYNHLLSKRIGIFNTEIKHKLIKKNRFIDKRNKQQVGLRWDVSNNSRGILTEKDFDLIKDLKYDAIIFSDYDKGAFDNREFTSLCVNKTKVNNIPSFLDSKSKDLEKFDGIDIFKPNNKEFEVYEKDDNHYFKFVVRTESENGMTLYDSRLHEIRHIESCVKNVVSTVGAGDTAMAGLVWGILVGETIEKSMEYANFLSGKSCLHPGTYVITQDDLNSAHMALDDDP